MLFDINFFLDGATSRYGVDAIPRGLQLIGDRVSLRTAACQTNVPVAEKSLAVEGVADFNLC